MEKLKLELIRCNKIKWRQFLYTVISKCFDITVAAPFLKSYFYIAGMTQADVCNEAPTSRRPMIMTARRRRRVVSWCFIFAPSQPWASLSLRSPDRPTLYLSHWLLSLWVWVRPVAILEPLILGLARAERREAKGWTFHPQQHHRHPEVKELVRTDTRPPPLSLAPILFAPKVAALARLSPPAPTVFLSFVIITLSSMRRDWFGSRFSLKATLAHSQLLENARARMFTLLANLRFSLLKMIYVLSFMLELKKIVKLGRITSAML